MSESAFVNNWLQRTRKKPPSKEMLYELAQRIESKSYDDDRELADIICLLRKAGAMEYRGLIEQFLYYPQASYVTKEAIKTLCIQWGLTEHYLETLKKFIRLDEWDTGKDLLIISMRLISEYLKYHYNRDLMRTLIDIYRQGENIVNHRSYYCAAYAYQSILFVMGKDWCDIPELEEILPILKEKRFKDLNQEILEKADQLLIADANTIQNDKEMLITKKWLGKRLKRRLEKGATTLEIANWAFQFQQDNLGENSHELNSILDDISFMEMGPEFEYSQKQLFILADNLIAEVENPIGK